MKPTPAQVEHDRGGALARACASSSRGAPTRSSSPSAVTTTAPGRSSAWARNVVADSSLIPRESSRGPGAGVFGAAVIGHSRTGARVQRRTTTEVVDARRPDNRRRRARASHRGAPARWCAGSRGATPTAASRSTTSSRSGTHRPDQGDRPLRARARLQAGQLRHPDDPRRDPPPLPRPLVDHPRSARPAGGPRPDLPRRHAARRPRTAAAPACARSPRRPACRWTTSSTPWPPGAPSAPARSRAAGSEGEEDARRDRRRGGAGLRAGRGPRDARRRAWPRCPRASA